MGCQGTPAVRESLTLFPCMDCIGFRSVALPAGGVVLAGSGPAVFGSTTVGGSSAPGFVAVIGDDGVARWARGLTTPDGLISGGPNAIAADPRGGVLVTRLHFLGPPSTNPPRVAVEKFDGSGKSVWTRTFTSTSERFDLVGAAVIAADGSITLVGILDRGAANPWRHCDDQPLRTVRIMRLDSAGQLVWRTNASELGYAQAIALSTSGRLAVVGPGPIVATFDTAGRLLWSKTLAYVGQDLRVAFMGEEVLVGGAFLSLDVGDDHFTAAGPTQETSLGQLPVTPDVFLLRFEQTGNVVWKRTFGTTEMEQVAGVAVDRTGAVTVCGMTRGVLTLDGSGIGTEGRQTVFVARLMSSGIALWSRALHLPAHAFLGTPPEGSGVDASGAAYVSGFLLPSEGGQHIYLGRFGP